MPPVLAPPRTYSVSPADDSAALLHGAPPGEAGTGKLTSAFTRNESAGSATTARPTPGLVRNTVPSGRDSMVTALGLARVTLSGAIVVCVTSPVRAELTCTARPLTSRPTSPVDSVTTGSPAGQGAGDGTEARAWPPPSGNTLTHGSGGGCGRTCAGCGSLVVHKNRSAEFAAAVVSASDGALPRWNGPANSPLLWSK